jgi:hypothetical protein
VAGDRGSDDVAALADRLRHDPVVVEQVLGNGRTHQVDQALTDLAHHAGVPVYVALVARPDGLANDDPAEDLAIRLHARVGQPGAYLVGVPGDVLSFKVFDTRVDELDAHGRWYPAVEGVRDLLEHRAQPDHLATAGEAALAIRALDGAPLGHQTLVRVAHDARWVATGQEVPADYDQPEPPVPTPVVGVATFALVTALAWRLLRARRAGRGTPRASTRAAASALPSLGALRKRATEAVAALEPRLRRRLTSDATGVDAAEDRAERSLAAARSRLDSRDPLELIGAWVLASDGAAALARPPHVFRPCFFHPLHGEGTDRARADHAAAVPACGRCADDVAEDRAPDVLRVGRRGRPYYEQRSVWAETGFGSLTDDLAAELAQPGRRR